MLTGIRNSERVLGLCILAGVALSACSGLELEQNPPAFSPALTQARVLDIQASRRGTTLYMTNTTARPYEAGRLWINQRFSAKTEDFEIGQTFELDLRAFVDEEGRRFRAGGFFATREPDDVVIAQLETGGELLGIVVVENRD